MGAAGLIHVDVSVNEAWRHNEVPVVQDLCEAGQKEGCMCQIGPGGIPVDGLHRRDMAILHLYCTQKKKDLLNTDFALHPDCLFRSTSVRMSLHSSREAAVEGIIHFPSCLDACKTNNALMGTSEYFSAGACAPWLLRCLLRVKMLWCDLGDYASCTCSRYYPVRSNYASADDDILILVHMAAIRPSREEWYPARHLNEPHVLETFEQDLHCKELENTKENNGALVKCGLGRHICAPTNTRW